MGQTVHGTGGIKEGGRIPVIVWPMPVGSSSILG